MVRLARVLGANWGEWKWEWRKVGVGEDAGKVEVGAVGVGAVDSPPGRLSGPAHSASCSQPRARVPINTVSLNRYATTHRAGSAHGYQCSGNETVQTLRPGRAHREVLPLQRLPTPQALLARHGRRRRRRRTLLPRSLPRAFSASSPCKIHNTHAICTVCSLSGRGVSDRSLTAAGDNGSDDIPTSSAALGLLAAGLPPVFPLRCPLSCSAPTTAPLLAGEDRTAPAPRAATATQTPTPKMNLYCLASC